MEQGNGVGAGQTGAVGGANPMGAEQVVAEQVTVAQVEPAAPAEPVTPVEPVAPGSMVAEPKTSKKGHGMAIGLIFCLLLAAGGVGLGVWAWMDGNTQKDALNSQIAELKKQNNELRDKLSSKSDAEEDVTVDVETDSDVDTTGYIYVGEYGIKIKKPENWRGVVTEYKYYNGYPMGAEMLEIRESSDPGDGVGIYISSEQCGEEVAAHRTCFTVGDVNVVVQQLVGELASVDDSTISEAFLNHFMNPENYSKI